MLLNIYIKNFLYFSDINIDLDRGLNVFTGETGAGKSLILDAIEFVLGDKGSYKDGTYVELTFEVEDDYSEDGILILAREVKNSKSFFYLNGRKVGRSIIEELSSKLIEIHGQHQSQNLFKKDYHRQTLDRFANLEELLKQYKDAYTEYKQCYQDLKQLKEKQSERLKMVDILSYQIKEIESLNLRKGEKEELEREYNYLKNIQLIRESVYNSMNILADDVLPQLKQIDRWLSKVKEYNSHLNQILNQISESTIILEDAYRGLSSFDLSDNNQLMFVEERLNQINSLERKYNTDADGLIELKNSLQQQLENFENLEEKIPELEKKAELLKERVFNLADKISTIRREKAKIFEVMVTQHLKELGFLSCDFKVYIERKDLDLYGFDKVEFLFSANKGFELKPLVEVASGGEISRLSLSIKLVSKKSVPTMIFDEIDTGIGGKTALTMAKKLKELSKDFQVILITHLPQIAVLSDVHYHVEKNIVGDRTFGTVKKLSKEEKVYEIARMLRGDVDTASIEYAKQFINSVG